MAKPQTRTTETSYSIAVPQYTTRTVDAPYHDTGGTYASPIGIGPHSSPSDQRVGHAPLRETNFHRSGAAETYYRQVNEPWLTEHNNAEHVEPVLQSENVGATLRFAAKPIAPAPSRWTAYLTPRTYFFQRKFGSDAREFDGGHFSMADHRRTYPILGMEPVRKRRNTDRLTPQPHDAFSKDQAPDPKAPIEITPINQVFTGTRSYRLS